jgi:molecular chaperone GrpE
MMEEQEQKMAADEVTGTGPVDEKAQAAGSIHAGESAAPSQDVTALRAELEAAQQRIAELERELAYERDKATEYMHNWQRAQADFANFRRRSKQEQEALAKYAGMDLFYELLAVLDNFGRAFQTLPSALREFTWINGIALTELQLRSTLQRHGVTQIEARGKEFNPLEHQAVAYAETDEVPENTVLEEIQHGYKLHDRVLRPALVKVARAKSATPPSEGGASDKETKEALSG